MEKRFISPEMKGRTDDAYTVKVSHTPKSGIGPAFWVIEIERAALKKTVFLRPDIKDGDTVSNLGAFLNWLDNLR